MVKKGIITGIVLFIIMLTLDIISTLLLGDLVQYLEANPLYRTFGIAGIITANLFIMFTIYWFYVKSKNPTNRFIALNLLVALTLTRIGIVYNNFQVYLNPPSVKEAMAVTPEMKVAAIATNMGVIFIPYLIGLITFMLFQSDHEIKIKETTQSNSIMKK